MSNIHGFGNTNARDNDQQGGAQRQSRAVGGGMGGGDAGYNERSIPMLGKNDH